MYCMRKAAAGQRGCVWLLLLIRLWTRDRDRDRDCMFVSKRRASAVRERGTGIGRGKGRERERDRAKHQHAATTVRTDTAVVIRVRWRRLPPSPAAAVSRRLPTLRVATPLRSPSAQINSYGISLLGSLLIRKWCSNFCNMKLSLYYRTSMKLQLL